MLEGRFGNTTGRPYLTGRVEIPSIGVAGGLVSFLVDTGADKTVLMPTDAQRLGIDYSKIGKEVESCGVGGISKDCQVAALFTFADKSFLYIYLYDLIVMRPRSDNMQMSSLLGRNILNRWKLTVDPSNGVLTGEVRSCTQQQALSPKK